MALMKPMDESIWWNPWLKLFDEIQGWNQSHGCHWPCALEFNHCEQQYFQPWILKKFIHVLKFLHLDLCHSHHWISSIQSISSMLSPSSVHKVSLSYVCFQLCDEFHDHTFIRIVSPFFFVANFHNLEIVSATFMEEFWGRKWPEVRFRGKEVFLLWQDFFYWKNKMGLFNPRTLC